MNHEEHESNKETFRVLRVFRGSTEFEVFFVVENALVACFDSGTDETFVKELAGFEPLRVYFAITALLPMRSRSMSNRYSISSIPPNI